MRLAVEMPFGEAAKQYAALSGISISAREIARITEERGAVLEERRARERAELLEGTQRTDKSRRALVRHRTWAVALDAAKVRFEDGWHEVKTGAVFWVEAATGKQGVGEQGQAGRAQAREQSYIAEVGSMEEAGAGRLARGFSGQDARRPAHRARAVGGCGARVTARRTPVCQVPENSYTTTRLCDAN